MLFGFNAVSVIAFHHGYFDVPGMADIEFSESFLLVENSDKIRFSQSLRVSQWESTVCLHGSLLAAHNAKQTACCCEPDGTEKLMSKRE